MIRKKTFFDYVLIIFFVIVSFMVLFPFINILAKSFSGALAVTAGKVMLYPIDFTLDVYKYVLTETGFMKALWLTIFVTIIGTVVGLTITVLMAYPLSKSQLKGRKTFLGMVVFSMLFYGGIVPSYFVMKQYRMINTVFALIVPTIFSPFNMLIMKTFFEGIPESLEESAKIDGAGNLRTLISIVLPISLPTLATIGLFYAVTYWNNYYHPRIFVSRSDLAHLTVFLHGVINSSEDSGELISMTNANNISNGNYQAGVIILSALPMMIIYPFLQKYFVHGLTLGSVKG